MGDGGRKALVTVAQVRHARIMGIGNRVVAAILRSPAHRLLSGSTCVVRYRGRRSGAEFSTPTQYARHSDGLIVLVGRPETKQAAALLTAYLRRFPRVDRQLPGASTQAKVAGSVVVWCRPRPAA